MTYSRIKVSTGFKKSETTQLPNFTIPPLRNSLPAKKKRYAASQLKWHR